MLNKSFTPQCESCKNALQRTFFVITWPEAITYRSFMQCTHSCPGLNRSWTILWIITILWIAANQNDCCSAPVADEWPKMTGLLKLDFQSCIVEGRWSWWKTLPQLCETNKEGQGSIWCQFCSFFWCWTHLIWLWIIVLKIVWCSQTSKSSSSFTTIRIELARIRRLRHILR